MFKLTVRLWAVEATLYLSGCLGIASALAEPLLLAICSVIQIVHFRLHPIEATVGLIFLSSYTVWLVRSLRKRGQSKAFDIIVSVLVILEWAAIIYLWGWQIVVYSIVISRVIAPCLRSLTMKAAEKSIAIRLRMALTPPKPKRPTGK